MKLEIGFAVLFISRHSNDVLMSPKKVSIVASVIRSQIPHAIPLIPKPCLLGLSVDSHCH